MRTIKRRGSFSEEKKGSFSKALNLSAKFSNYVNPSFAKLLGTYQEVVINW